MIKHKKERETCLIQKCYPIGQEAAGEPSKAYQTQASLSDVTKLGITNGTTEVSRDMCSMV